MMTIYRIFAALFYDTLILISLLMLMTVGCVFYNNGQAIPPHNLIYQTLLIIIIFGYYIISIRWGGQTIGMRAWRLKIIGGNNKLTVTHVFRRLILYLPAILIAIIRWQSPQTLLQRWSATRLVIVSL